jgi:hypothetical protein
MTTIEDIQKAINLYDPEFTSVTSEGVSSYTLSRFRVAITDNINSTHIDFADRYGPGVFHSFRLKDYAQGVGLIEALFAEHLREPLPRTSRIFSEEAVLFLTLLITPIHSAAALS